MQERIARRRPEAAHWPELAAVMEATEQEINLFARFGDSYSYVSYILRKP